MSANQSYSSILIRKLAKYGLIVLCHVAKFLYGFLFGAFMWYILVHPYSRYYDFEQNSYLPELVFCLIIAVIFMSFRWIRTMMVLFLPSMIGNASQNYIIVLLIIGLFAGPVASIAVNATESVRVIGCSLMMTFEQLRERTKLLLNPIIAVLTDTNQTELAPIKEDLLTIQDAILNIRHEAELNRKLDDQVDSMTPVEKKIIEPTKKEIVDDIRSRIQIVSNKTNELANKTMELIRNSTNVEFDQDNLGLKLNIDVNNFKNYIKFNKMRKNKVELNEFNLTEIMYENCLGIFRKAKLSCEVYIEELRQSCQNTIGLIFATIWCSPITLTLTRTCPWIMDQLIDENNLCKELRVYSAKLTTDPFNITGGANVNDVYKNLTQNLISLNDDLIEQDTSDIRVPQRLELTVGLNNQTRSLLFEANKLLRFIGDKYKMRKFFLNVLLFLYDLYTTITFLFIMLQAYQYERKYLTQIRFDNHYITEEFVDLDKQRKSIGKGGGLLPLTREESRKYITTYTCKRRTSEERHTQRVNYIQALIFLAITFSLIYFDDIFHSILVSINEHALITYKEVGRHNLKVIVHGEGSIAKLVKKLLANLNSTYDLNRLTSTRKCLPSSISTSNKFYIEYIYLSLIYLFIDQISIYAMRFRHQTAAFFYPDKEKRRIKFLYNFILLQRQNYRKLGIDIEDFKGEVEGEENANDDDEENIYSLKDALTYIKTCVQDSLACCSCNQERESKFKRRSKPFSSPKSSEKKPLIKG